MPKSTSVNEDRNTLVEQPFIVATVDEQGSKIKSHLERYAEFFDAVEINSSFYRPHMPKTYVRWRLTVPSEFRFSVKLPKNITHHLRLENCDSELQRFMFEAGHLEDKLGCLLIQIPPSLQFDAKVANEFLSQLRDLSNVSLALEPRHVSWFESTAFHLLEQHDVALVQADPRPTQFSIVDLPQTSSTIYIRLHGSPIIYFSSYDQQYLENLSAKLILKSHESERVWCVFDNTAQDAAFRNAMILRTILNEGIREQ